MRERICTAGAVALYVALLCLLVAGCPALVAWGLGIAAVCLMWWRK